MKIFFVHGIGHGNLDQNYYQPWETDVSNQLKSSGLQTDPHYDGSRYDPLFREYNYGPATYAARHNGNGSFRRASLTVS